MKSKGFLVVLILAAGAAVILWLTKPVGEEGPEKKPLLEKKIQAVDKAKELSTQVNLKAIQREIFVYISEYGRAPENLQQILQTAQLMSGDKDAWGTPVQYKQISDDSFQLISAGNDREFDTSDDIVLKY